MHKQNRNHRSKKRPITIIGILGFIPLLLFVDNAQACSCLSAGPPCQAFWKADAVFLATVKSKSVVTVEVDSETKRTEQQVSVRFLVDDVYRGLLGGSDVEILTGIDSAACGYNFEKGKRYLVYAQEDGNKLRTTLCSRTRLLTDAKKDLLYFQNLPPEGSGASISVKVLTRSASNETTAMPGVKVTAEGPDKLFEGRTGSSGQYEFKRLPPGKYTVKSEIAQTPRNQWQAEVTVEDRACVEVEFSNNVAAPGFALRTLHKGVTTRTQ